MQVKRFMTWEPIAIYKDESALRAFELMEKHKVKRLPVVDTNYNVVGIISRSDLKIFSNTEKDRLLMEKIKVKGLMTENPATVAPETLLEDAIKLMREKGVGGLPVVIEKRLVGIITEYDIFTAMLEGLGAEREGIRITFEMEDKPGNLAKVVNILGENSINIISIHFFKLKEKVNRDLIFLKVEPILNREKLQEELEEIGLEVKFWD